MISNGIIATLRSQIVKYNKCNRITNAKNIGVRIILINAKIIYNISNLKLPSLVGNLLLVLSHSLSKIFLIPTYLSIPLPSLCSSIN